MDQANSGMCGPEWAQVTGLRPHLAATHTLFGYSRGHCKFSRDSALSSANLVTATLFADFFSSDSLRLSEYVSAEHRHFGVIKSGREPRGQPQFRRSLPVGPHRPPT